jgi:phosphate transport system substrate-binding protein
MKRRRLISTAAAGLVSLVSVFFPIALHVLASVTVVISGSSQMYALGELLTNRYHQSHPDFYPSVNITSSVFGFNNVCLGSVNIAMADAYIQDAQLQQAGCADIINVPVAVSSVAVVYNLPGGVFNKRTSDQFTLVHPVRFTPKLLGEIYDCKVTRWNDPEIKKLNPSLPLPSARIQAYNSAEPGGSGFVFSEWMAFSDPNGWGGIVDFNSLQPAWPGLCSTGVDASGPMVDSISKTQYSLGFVGFDYAITNHLQAAALQNGSGEFQTPSLAGISKAAYWAVHKRIGPYPPGHGISDDFRTAIVNVVGSGAYNPSCFEFFDVHSDYRHDQRGSTFKNFLLWSVGEQGQGFIKSLGFHNILKHGYAPLPAEIVDTVNKYVRKIKV